MKYDFGKLRYDILPFRAIQKVAQVMNFGVEKYGKDTWKDVKNFEERYINALFRHLYAYYIDGEKIDSESGISHLAHSAVNVLFLLEKECLSFEKTQN